MKKTILIIIYIASLSLISCDKNKDCPACFTPPQELKMKITDYSTGKDLIFDNVICPDSVEIFYHKNNDKVIVEHEIYLDSVNLRAILYSYEISWISPTGNKDFYLYLGNNDIDTLFLDVEERHDDCCTFFEWLDFKINGNAMEIDHNDPVYGVYDYMKSAHSCEVDSITGN